MRARTITEGVELIGAVDWDRRLFDSLIPLPDGTSYNAYLVRGSEKTALLDTVDPSMAQTLMNQLEAVPDISFIISHHAEQDHSGTIPAMLDKYPRAELLCSPKAKNILAEHLDLPLARIRVLEDGEKVELGGKTLRCVHTPWVHWPETMCTYLEEDKILFSCDFLGSHLATTDTFSGEAPYVFEAAKRYYAEIMMPFRPAVRRNLAKLDELEIEMIAPSHGPVHDRPAGMINAYKDWTSDRVDNSVVIPFISMHGSTEKMVDRLVNALVENGVKASRFNLVVADIGKLAMSLVDAATVVVATPTVHFGPHPAVYSAAHLVNALRPKLKFAAVIGSYGWGSKAVEQVAGLISDLKAELLGTVMCKGLPGEADLKAIDELAAAIAEKHRTLNQ